MNITALNDTRNAKWVALALFVITVFTRIPFHSNYLYHWDSVNMAFGMEHFNPADGAPHFPGYFAYIVVADILNPLFGNANTTLVIISIISSGIAVAALFYLGREIFNPTIGLIAAVLLMTSPLVWFYGEIALPHTPDMMCVIIAAYLLYKIMNGETRLVWITAIFLGIVGGFRYVTLGFMIPLAVFAGYRIGIKRIIGVGIIMAVLTILWVIPTLNATGGLENYMVASKAFSADFFDTTSLLAGAGLFGLKRNLVEKLLPYTAYAWGLAALPALYFLIYIPRFRSWLKNRAVWFFILWAAPPIGFYVIIHMGQQGYVFTFLPACMLLSAKGLYELLKSRPAMMQAAAAGLALVAAAIFILAPIYPLGENGPKLLNYKTLQESDQMWSDKIALVESQFSPENTLLVAENWRHVQYYLRDYHLARFSVGGKYEASEGQVLGADHVNQPVSAEQLGLTPGQDWKVVVLDDDLSALASDPASLQQTTLPDGYSLSYMTLTPEQAYWTDGQKFGVQNISATTG